MFDDLNRLIVKLVRVAIVVLAALGFVAMAAAVAWLTG